VDDSRRSREEAPMDEALIWQMKAVFSETSFRPADLTVLSDAVFKLAGIFAVEMKVHIEEPTKTRPYPLLRASRPHSPGISGESYFVKLEDGGGYQASSYFNAPDNSITEKHYDDTGLLALDIVANWKLRKDIGAKLKLMKESRTRNP
jgi:hypothetical protein